MLEKKRGTLLRYGVEVFGKQSAGLFDLTELRDDLLSILSPLGGPMGEGVGSGRKKSVPIAPLIL